jgi:hypothetical protein
MLSREWNVSVRDLQGLHRKSVSLLEMLKTHLPDRVDWAQGWNFEKAHSILHKVREIVMWGWSENTSCQGPEQAHIDIIKSGASHKQQGRFSLRSAISWPLWPVAAV